MDPVEPWDELISQKRGGKRRKAPKRKRRVRKQADVGDTVYLLPGNVPIPLIHHTHKRLVTPGHLYSELPKVLRQQSYGIAPNAYRPMTQHEFISAGDKMYARGRNFYDDIMINVNPSNIEPNRVPSKRLVPSYNKNTAPTVNQPIVSSLPFRGDTPAIHLVADRTPSVRAAPSQPSAAAFAGVHYAIPSGAAIEQYANQMEQQAALQDVAEARKPVKRYTQAQYDKMMKDMPPAQWNTWSGWRRHLNEARDRYPTLKDVREETGFSSYKQLIEHLKDEYDDEESFREKFPDSQDTLDSIVSLTLSTMKRGGIRRRGRGGY